VETKDIVEKLEQNGGKMNKQDLYRSFSSGENPSDMLFAAMCNCLDTLVSQGVVVEEKFHFSLV